MIRSSSLKKMKKKMHLFTIELYNMLHIICACEKIIQIKLKWSDVVWLNRK